MRALLVAFPLLISGLACSSTPSASTVPEAPAAASSSQAGPPLAVRREVKRLETPWDVQQIPGALLITERDKAGLLVHRKGRTRALDFPSDQVWVAGETGLMSLAVDPRFAENRRIYTCQGGFTASGTDVRVVAWRLNKRYTRATGPQVLLSRLPVSSGRHGGCRLLIDRESGALYVGTGDAAIGTNPRDLTSLGGKVLRLNRRTGAPWPANPYAAADDRRQRYVLTYGHRNVQGLAQRRDGSVWSVEHGSYRDDEVNLLRPGGDYGWNPVPGYNEEVPMTDQSLPGRQVDAAWSSGNPTIATSGAAWVRGKQWGELNGTLAVAALAGSRLLFMKFDKAGSLRWTRSPSRLAAFGRLRSVTAAGNGDLLVTTSNGSSDAVLRVRPRR